MTLSLIVAMTDDRVIGNKNQLPWHLSEDLKRFKKITMGHPIIMGRKTFASIGKPLPGRQNIVLTRDPSFQADGVTIVRDLCAAMAAAEQNTGETFVIGGAEIFKAALPLAQKLYLTLIHHPFEGDVLFPEYKLNKDFRVLERSEHQNETPRYDYTFLTAERL